MTINMNLEPAAYDHGYRLKDSDSWTDINNAWVSPQGSVYIVKWYGHETFARDVHDMSTSDLESKGWIHWSFGEITNWDKPYYTRAQKDSLYFLMMGVGDKTGANKIIE